MAERAFVSIYEAASRTLGCRISVSGRVLSERMLPPVKAGEVREIAGQYISLMSKGWNSKTKEYLSLLGSGLFHIFLESDWGSIEGRISSGADLVIASQIPEVHRLPWEYIPVMGMALGRRFRILHHPMAVDELPTLSRLPPPGPLRLLFMGSAPLDHEGEALSVIRAAEGLDLILEIGETGTLQELRDLTAALRPHLVHLLAEGRMVEGEPRLVFQGETGRHDLRTAEELLEALEGVQSLLLSGHQAGMEPLDLLCQRAAATLPFAVRLTAPAGDLSLLYSALASGRPLKDALWAHAQSSDRPQPMPALYVGSDQEMLFDPGGRSEAAHDIERGVRPLPGMTEGYSRSFVGRRSELQGSLSALREGSVRAILITGADGSGRSTLATRLARSLGGPALTIYSSSSNPITSVRILEGGIRLLEGSGRQRDAIRLRDPSRSIDERLVELLDLLSQDGILIIVDGLADDVGKDPELEAIIQRLLRGTGPSRVIITSASLPDGNRQLPPQTRELHLEGLTESAFIVRLLRERTVADLYRQGSLGYRDLHDLFVTTAGSPSCLDQMAAALGSGGSIGSCGQALYFLTSSLDVRSAAALGRTAVYETAFDQAGLAAVAGTSEDEAGALAEEWERLSLVYRAGDLLAVPSSIRASLRDTMGSEDLQAARRAAAGHLRALAESSRSTELGLSRLDCLMEARGQSLAARDLEEARAVTSRISGYLEGRGYYRLLLRLNQELYDLEPHPTPAGWIARGHLDLGDYDQAEGWYRSLV
ncbi:MAG: AAA family ATPase [Methanothrix sp.]|nr:AAA family ATPase [Methanothrix sp.]